MTHLYTLLCDVSSGKQEITINAIKEQFTHFSCAFVRHFVLDAAMDALRVEILAPPERLSDILTLCEKLQEINGNSVRVLESKIKRATFF
jgi:hypothetical protein